MYHLINNMFSFYFQFHSVTDKRSHNNECGENSVTIVTEKKIEDDSSDSSSGENVEIEGTYYFPLFTSIQHLN